MTSASPISAVEAIHLLSYPECGKQAIDIEELLRAAKIAAVERNDQTEASLLWKAQTIAAIQHGFTTAFQSLKSYEFYEAWCQLERCEIDVMALKRHHIPTAEDPHRIDYIERMISHWQSLYPYKVFFSPELLKKKVVCSICESPVSLRTDCGHEKFKIYDGELCHHRVVDVDILSISIVENPVQRYSVAFLAGDEGGKPKDHYNYGNVRFVVDRVDSPFHGWEPETTTRVIANSDVAHLPVDGPCPCLSGKAFGECCANKPHITVPHLQIHLYVRPNKALLANELLV